MPSHLFVPSSRIPAQRRHPMSKQRRLTSSYCVRSMSARCAHTVRSSGGSGRLTVERAGGRGGGGTIESSSSHRCGNAHSECQQQLAQHRAAQGGHPAAANPPTTSAPQPSGCPFGTESQYSSRSYRCVPPKSDLDLSKGAFLPAAESSRLDRRAADCFGGSAAAPCAPG
jgi:hypothetical protein